MKWTRFIRATVCVCVWTELGRRLRGDRYDFLSIRAYNTITRKISRFVIFYHANTHTHLRLYVRWMETRAHGDKKIGR